MRYCRFRQHVTKYTASMMRRPPKIGEACQTDAYIKILDQLWNDFAIKTQSMVTLPCASRSMRGCVDFGNGVGLPCTRCASGGAVAVGSVIFYKRQKPQRYERR